MSNSKSEQKLLETAKELFWRYGFRRVSVEEISVKAELSKMTFYRYFDNKLDIAKKVLSKELEQSMGEYREILESNVSFAEKMKATILLKTKHSEKIGFEFLHDIVSYGGEDFRAFLNEKREETTAMVKKSFKQAQKEGAIRKDLNLDVIPILSEHITNMASDSRLLDIYESPQAVIKELTIFFFHGILSHSEKA
jgi:AcrR family transcriptional regulator